MTKWKPENVPENFYRVSAKALVLNESRDKFLIVQEEDSTWEVPGGGIDFGETVQETLIREIDEEMSLKVLDSAKSPCYVTTKTKSSKGFWNFGVVYEVELEHLDFIPTKECVAVKFIGKEDKEWLKSVKSSDSVKALLELFDPKHHQ